MSQLLHKQQEFTVAIAKLILYADSLGCQLTFGDCYAGGAFGHMENSNHYRRLAVDFNLFVEGEYINDGDNHMWAKLHEYFEELGGAPMIKKDANHFSFKHRGII